jgi:hypothetical protein
MRKKFLLKGETDQDGQIYLAIEFKIEDKHILLHSFLKKDTSIEDLRKWVKGDIDLPKAVQIYKSGVSDETMLPEEVRVDDIGKARDIEIEWGNLIIQHTLLQGFDSDLNILKEKIVTLEDFSQEVFDECSHFWEKLLEYKKDFNLPNESVQKYKNEIDILFDALKSLRKDHRKEIDEQSIVHYNRLKENLEKIEHHLNENPDLKSIIKKLKSIRTDFNKSAMRKSHKQEIDQFINLLFEKLGNKKKKIDHAKTGKRINDLSQILEKMNKGIDWDLKTLAKEEKNLKRSEQKFQVQLLETKIKMLKDKIEEKVAKRNNIQNTLNDLKGQEEA